MPSVQGAGSDSAFNRGEGIGGLGVLSGIPFQEIVEAFLSPPPGLGRVLQLGVAAQVIGLVLKGDLGDPFSGALVPVDSAHAAGVVFGDGL